MKKYLLTLVALLCLGFTMNAQEQVVYTLINNSNGLLENKIYTAFTDGSNIQELISSETFFYGSVTVNKNGNKIVFDGRKVAGSLTDSLWFFTANSDGSDITLVGVFPNTENELLNQGMDISENGESLIVAIEFNPSCCRDAHIYELNFSTGIFTQLSSNDDYTYVKSNPRYYSNDTKIAYSKRETDWYAWPHSFYSINRDGSNVTLLPKPTGDGTYGRISFFSNQNKYVFNYQSDFDNSQLYIYDVTSENLTNLNISGIYPYLSKDENKILYAQSNWNSLNICDLDGNITNSFNAPDGYNFFYVGFDWIFSDYATIYFQNYNAFTGRIIEIPIISSELQVSDGILAYQFDFNYDNTKLEYLSNTLTGTLASGGSLQVNPTTGKLAIAWARETPIVGEGAIIKLQFKVIDAGVTTPTITNALYNTEAVNATNGTITATYKYGDIDANDHVQAYDAALAIQYSVGLDPIPAIDPLPWENWRIVTANVDGIGGVTANDASEILKYTVGLITVFPVEDTKKSGSASNADINFSVENGEIVLTSTGELFGLNVFVNENFSALGMPVNLVENSLFAKNISATNYAFAIATAKSPANNANIIRIPYSTAQNQSVTLDMIVNTEVKSVTVGLTTGIVTINEKSVLLYPNPANSVLYLSGVENVNVSIFDISGRNVFNQLNVNNQIDISTLPKGLYTVKIENGNESITRKLIKN